VVVVALEASGVVEDCGKITKIKVPITASVASAISKASPALTHGLLGYLNEKISGMSRSSTGNHGYFLFIVSNIAQNQNFVKTNGASLSAIRQASYLASINHPQLWCQSPVQPAVSLPLFAV